MTDILIGIGCVAYAVGTFVVLPKVLFSQEGNYEEN